MHEKEDWLYMHVFYGIILSVLFKISKFGQPKEVFLTDGNETSFESIKQQKLKMKLKS